MGPKIISYRDLVVWQQAMDLADLVYRITDKFPAQERFGLVVQMRKAAVSVPSNIAEGSRHRTPGYISRVVIALGEHAEVIALGEHAELETQVLLGERRRYIDAIDMKRFNALSKQVGELAHALSRSLEALPEP
ncbi:MAG TPA: four helix bundle protein [Vicinamibacterales bacterium]|nr:four helix bundle protein [Vicinamibacterales bacterium]